MSRVLKKTDEGHIVEVSYRSPVFQASLLGEGQISAYLRAETLEELAAGHADIGTYLTDNGYPALDSEPPAFDPEYVAEALRSTFRATSFEGGVSEDLVEEFIAAYEKAVEDGSRQ